MPMNSCSCSSLERRITSYHGRFSTVWATLTVNRASRRNRNGIKAAAFALERSLCETVKTVQKAVLQLEDAIGANRMLHVKCGAIIRPIKFASF